MNRVNISDINFPVKEIPAIWKDKENGNILNENTGHKFIIREDTGKILSCMTDNYRLVQMFGGGARSMVKWEFPKHKIKIAKQDEMTPEIVWQNSYDGTIGLNIIAGAFRLICLNGAVIGIIATKYKNKHIVQNMELDDIEGVIDETIRKTKIMMKEEFPLLFDTKIKDTHVLKILKMFPITSSDYITQKLIQDKPKNLWDLFNVSTNVATHGLDRRLEATHKLESKLYKTVLNMALGKDKAIA